MSKFQKKLKKIPQRPGVYMFYGSNNKLLYVGKANNLKSRVRCYFTKSTELTAAKQLMVQEISKLDYTVVDTETEALLLETNLIKKHKPPYNIMLKDDKDWQYIKIDYAGPWAQIYSVRRPTFAKSPTHHSRDGAASAGKPQVKKNNKDKFPRTKAKLGAGFRAKALHFGPYTSSLAVKESLRQIKKLFPICLNLPKKANQTTRACFNYHLDRCLGPCVGDITPQQYAKLFSNIIKFLKGDYKKLITVLESKMMRDGQSKRFESAAKTRNILTALKKLNQRQNVVLNFKDNFDLISLYKEDSVAALNLFKVRQGKLLGKFNTLAKNIAHQSSQEIIESFIKQYYLATTDLPTQVITLYKLENKITGLRFTQAKRGKKTQLLKLGSHNAYEYLRQQSNFFDRIKKRKTALKELQKLFKLSSIPTRIEAYDIANIQGVSAVGGMVVFEAGQAKKSDYRKFTIKTVPGANDPAMMAEVLKRRFHYLPPTQGENKRGLKNKTTTSFADIPDLIVLDGGKPQLTSVAAILKNLKTGKLKNIPIIALAKREEDIYITNRKNPLKLPKRSPALQLLQTIRDEVHHYANSFFQAKHKQKTLSSSLDNIPGIGPKTKKILKANYGSLSKISSAPTNELTKLVGKHRTKIIKNASTD